jgi:hypothetical protein
MESVSYVPTNDTLICSLSLSLQHTILKRQEKKLVSVLTAMCPHKEALFFIFTFSIQYTSDSVENFDINV